jgi:hypothetical protein
MEMYSKNGTRYLSREALAELMENGKKRGLPTGKYEHAVAVLTEAYKI